jgi:hypothetical protein
VKDHPVLRFEEITALSEYIEKPLKKLVVSSANSRLFTILSAQTSLDDQALMKVVPLSETRVESDDMGTLGHTEKPLSFWLCSKALPFSLKIRLSRKLVRRASLRSHATVWALSKA